MQTFPRCGKTVFAVPYATFYQARKRRNPLGGPFLFLEPENVKKKRHKNPWGKVAQAPSTPTEPRAAATAGLETVTPETILAPISPAQLAANRANAQLSSGPRTAAGLEKSSKNAVKTALTGRTVLLPTDDVEEYAAFVNGLEHDLKPVGAAESELVQIIADCHWRLRRIQTLEYALYAHGDEQFAGAFPNCSKEERYSKTLLQTHLTYEKQLRNLHIQEARLDRKRSKALAELHSLQSQRCCPDETDSQPDEFLGFPSEQALFAALDAGFIPPNLAARIQGQRPASENGFVFSNGSNSTVKEAPADTSAA
ncbi:MAG: hypothetical protein JO051_14945 [Acidobacteriaceae bacterium]|nr:hypothetical protein [Acidobacteriaceae bacterium]